MGASKTKHELPQKARGEVAELARKMAELSAEFHLDLMELNRQVLGEAISFVLEQELAEHLGYDKGAAPPEGQPNRRNGATTKRLRTEFGAVEIKVPRDRLGTFRPKFVEKHQRSLAGFEEKIRILHRRGMSLREICRTVQDLYGVRVSTSYVNEVTRTST